ncbi:hypothetical protein EUR_30740 [Agathobacter rectalis DSM 17629]|nr:hypothetical protein EUR_30740 [Agathobacter rectalis DSM 17629]
MAKGSVRKKGKKWSSTKGCAGTVRALRCQYHHECLCTLCKKSQAEICKVT